MRLGRPVPKVGRELIITRSHSHSSIWHKGLHYPPRLFRRQVRSLPNGNEIVGSCCDMATHFLCCHFGYEAGLQMSLVRELLTEVRWLLWLDTVFHIRGADIGGQRCG